MRTGNSEDLIQIAKVLYERRWIFAAWLAFTMGSAVGGWFFGRSQFLPSRAPEQETRTRKFQRTESLFAADSPKGQWTERVKKASPADFPRLMEEWRTLFPETEDGLEGQPEHALRWLYAQWLLHDQEGFVKAASDPGFYSSYQSVEVIVQIKPELAAELLRGIESDPLDKHFTDGLASNLASQQPAIYLSLNPDGTADFTPGDNMSNDDWETAIFSLAKTDPVAAANGWKKVKLENNDSTVLNALLPAFEAWRAEDPSLKDWVSQIENLELRNLAQHARLIALARKDAHAALAELYSTHLQHNYDLRTNAPGEILTQLAKQDLPAALRLLKETSPLFALPRNEPFSSNSGGADVDPFAEPPDESAAPPPASEPAPSGPPPNPFIAAASSNDTPEDNWMRDVLLRDASEYLPKDPDEMFAALHQLRTEMGGESDWQRQVEAELIRYACASFPVESCLAAAKLWAAELNGALDDKTFQSLAARAAATDPEKAAAALEELPAAVRASFVAEIIQQLPPDQQERRASLLAQLTPVQWDKELGESLGKNATDYAEVIAALPGATTTGAREAFMEKWVQNDPEAATHWFDSLPQDDAAGPAALGLFNGWAEFDKPAAVAWAESLPDGPAHKAVALDVVRALGVRSPGDAWRWAATITDPKIRAWAYNTISVDHDDEPEAFKQEHAAALRAAGME